MKILSIASSTNEYGVFRKKNDRSIETAKVLCFALVEYYSYSIQYTEVLPMFMRDDLKSVLPVIQKDALGNRALVVEGLGELLNIASIVDRGVADEISRIADAYKEEDAEN